jgi:glycerol kinase
MDERTREREYRRWRKAVERSFGWYEEEGDGGPV